MSRRPILWLIGRREVRMRLRSRAFRLGTLVFVLLILALPMVAGFLSGRTQSPRVAFVGEAAPLAQPFVATAAALGTPVAIVQEPDEAAGRADVQTGRLDALVSGPPTAPIVFVETDVDQGVRVALDQVAKQATLAQQVAAAGLDPAIVLGRIVRAAATIERDAPETRDRGPELLLGLMTGLALMYALIGYGTLVAAGVVEEKSTRIVEILLATVRPRQLLAGKVLGIGFVGLLQMAILVLTGILVVSITHVVSLPAVGASVLALDLVWFLLGYFFYATLFAISGALISRHEDLANATMFPILLLVAGFFLLATVVRSDPGSNLSTLLSLMPPWSALLMAFRLASSPVPAWQIAAAIVLTAGSALALTSVAGRIYSGSILRTGSRVGFLEGIRGR